ncbi:MAG: aldo/keto reductase [Aeriscardovia sp.]|nr:aldo/keto reductase [Aeriscardovia sp.]
MNTHTHFTLRNGMNLPSIGYGTWLIPNDHAASCVFNAIQQGYRLIDTAEAYANEQGVGEGIQRAINQGLVTRQDIILTTKLAAEFKTYDRACTAIDHSLEKAHVDHFDLMLIHAPQPWDHFREGKYYEGNREAWKALEQAYNDGKISAIGVANFEEDDLTDLMDHCSIQPMVNQILCHIGNTPQNLIDFCHQNSICVEGYSPIAHGAALSHTTISQLAEKYHVTPTQLCIRYDMQLGIIPLPKTENADHMAENLKTNFTITDDDMKQLHNLPKYAYDVDGEWACFQKA